MTTRDLHIPKDIANTLVDPKAHGSDRIHEACKWLRANNPIAVAEPDGYDPFWIFSRHEDIRFVAQQNQVFHSGDRNITLQDKAEERRVRELTGGRPTIVRNLINMDPPDHPKYRGLAEKYFTRESIGTLEIKVRGIAKQFVDKLGDFDGTCDFAKEIAFLYPLRVIMSILGVPPEDEPLMLRLSQELFGLADEEQARGAKPKTGAEAAEAFAAVSADFDAYITELLAAKRAKPQDDFATIIANAEIDGQPMPLLEALSYVQVVATAGHDTTAAASAGGVWGLCENPGEFTRAKADPSLVPAVVGEAIRWTSPSKITMRMATRDVDYGGRNIKAGDSIALAWVSANRDEDVFEDSAMFKIDRSPHKLLAFGWGPHTCLGQHLARLEMRVLFEELLGRVTHMELAGTPRTLASLMVSGPKTVPIHYRMA